jgi:hypothetical protein
MLATQQNKIRWMGIDMRPRWRRRITIAATYLALVSAAGWLAEWQGHGWLTPVKALFGVYFATELLTIFRDGGLVKTFEVLPKPLQGMTLSEILVNLLTDKWKVTRKKHLPPTMQANLEQILVDSATKDLSPEAPDERECVQRDQASRLTLRMLSVILAYSAMNAGINGKNWNPPTEVAFILSYLVIARTGAQARILWSEPDPREAPGEIELVPGATHN